MAELSSNAILRISDEQTMQLIELYEREGCLWNTTLEDYKNKDKRSEAAIRIAKELRIKNFGPKHVLSKFKNLRNSYCQELKKIANSLVLSNDGDYEGYKPRVFWFNKMDSFLRPHLQATRRMPHQDVEKEGDEVEEWVQMTNPEDVLLPDTNYLEPSCSEHEDFVERFRNRKRKVSSDTQSSKRYRPEDTLQTQRDASMESHNDCFDSFSSYIASLLRTLPLQKAMVLQSKIVEDITKAIVEENKDENTT